MFNVMQLTFLLILATVLGCNNACAAAILNTMTSSNCSDDIRALFMGFRHGARSVTVYLPNDENNSKWTVALGQLTPQGMQQHYKNGQLVSTKYSPFFDRYDATKLLARSSSVDRTLMSASTFLASLVQPTGNQIFLQGLNWQPAALYTSAILEANTPTKLLDQVAKKIMPGVVLTDPKTVAILENASGIKAKRDPLMFFQLLDNLVTEMFAGFGLPYGLNNKLARRIKNLKDLAFMGIFGDPEVRCLLAPPILNDFIEKTDKVLQNETDQFLYIWSMHDTNVFSVLSVLNDYRSESPPFAATLFFEVLDVGNCLDNEIKLIYRKDVESVDIELEIKDCSHPCTLSNLKRVISAVNADCNSDPNH